LFFFFFFFFFIIIIFYYFLFFLLFLVPSNVSKLQNLSLLWLSGNKGLPSKFNVDLSNDARGIGLLLSDAAIHFGAVEAAQKAGQGVVVVHDHTCNVCEENIVGARLVCLDCDDYDECVSCYGVSNHPAHHRMHVIETADGKVTEHVFAAHEKRKLARVAEQNDAIRIAVAEAVAKAERGMQKENELLAEQMERENARRREIFGEEARKLEALSGRSKQLEAERTAMQIVLDSVRSELAKERENYRVILEEKDRDISRKV
jgi:hypothetical protein